MIRPAGHRRRARLSLTAGGAAFALLAAAVLLLRARTAPYLPGAEAATSDEITRSLMRTLPEGSPRPRFTDAAEEAGIRFAHFHGTRSSQLPEDMGSGLAWGDYDDDGDPDLFLVNESGPLTDSPEAAAASLAHAALYRNDGQGAFTDVTEAAGLAVRGTGMGAAWGDYDGDGRLDLFVSRFGTSLLFRNKGDGTFEDVTAATGVGAPEGFWTGASWADYDRDGDLDLYVCGYVRYKYDATLAGLTSTQYRAVVPFTLNPSTFPPERNLLFRNDGGRFREVGRTAGVDNSTGRSLSAAWTDFDADGWPDLYVANDISDNAMLRNRGDGTFTDVSHAAWVADYRGAMGLAIGDWENDGDLDIFITHWIAQENALYENQLGTLVATPSEPMHFVDGADLNGLGQIALDFVGWGTGFIDYDNDGRLDLFVVNGSTFQREEDPSRLVPMTNQLFWNAGRGKGFYEVGAAGGGPFATENVGRGAAFADYDADGDVDIAVVVNGGPARLLRNDGKNTQAWLRVVLRGPSDAPGAVGARRAAAHLASRGAARHATRRATSSFATGALVKVTTGSLTQMREVGSGPSCLSQSPPGEVTFGVGDAKSIDRLEVTWPSGLKQTLRGLAPRATVRLVEGQASEAPTEAPPAEPVAEIDAERRASVLRFWQVFNEATSVRRAGDFARAASLYREALVINSHHEDSLYYLGQSLQETGDYDGAREAFVRLVALNRSSARGHLALGALMASPDLATPFDLAAAEEQFRQAHAINQEETGPMVRLGKVLIVPGDLAQAREWLEGAARTNPKSIEAAFLAGDLRQQQGDAAGARDYYRKALRAAQTEAPIKGVLSEGDRKAVAAASTAAAATTAAATHLAAPPMQAPMGKTLFGKFTAPLRAGNIVDPGTDPRGPDPSAVYAQVRDYTRALRRRMPRG